MTSFWEKLEQAEAEADAREADPLREKVERTVCLFHRGLCCWLHPARTEGKLGQWTKRNMNGGKKTFIQQASAIVGYMLHA